MPLTPNALMTAFGTITLPYEVTSTDMAAFVTNINQALNATPDATFSRYTTAGTPAANAWSQLVPTLAEGTGTGLTMTAGGVFTLAAGTWDVDWSVQTASSMLQVLALTTGTAAVFTAGSTNIIASNSAPAVASVSSVSVHLKIRSTGTTTVAAWQDGANAVAPSVWRLTFQRTSST